MHRRKTMWRHKEKMVIYKKRREAIRRNLHWQHPDLEHVPSRIMKKYNTSVSSYPVCGNLLQPYQTNRTIKGHLVCFQVLRLWIKLLWKCMCGILCGSFQLILLNTKECDCRSQNKSTDSFVRKLQIVFQSGSTLEVLEVLHSSEWVIQYPHVYTNTYYCLFCFCF